MFGLSAVGDPRLSKGELLSIKNTAGILIYFNNEFNVYK